MEIMNDSVITHNFIIYIFLAIMLFNMYSVLSVNNFMVLAKRLRLTTPIYHCTNAIIMYTGAIVSAYMHDLSPTVILMIMTSIFLMVAEIKRYKKMRVIKTSDTALQEEFYSYAKKIYVIEITALIFVYMICKVF